MSGTITGSHSSTVTLTSNPSTVTSTATIKVANGAGLTGTSTTAWVLTNYGYINGGGTAGVGVSFGGGGTVTNKAGGTIDGGRYAIHITGGAARIANYGQIDGARYGIDLLGSTVNTGTVVSTVTNSATITGGIGAGVVLHTSGTVTNKSAGLIDGGDNGVVLTNATLVNAGHVVGAPGAGAAVRGGSVINQIGGTIYGSAAGVGAYQKAVTVSNA